MRITRLDMENFGPFNGRRVDGFSPGLTVVHGENEAGKSALRAFMRVVLFGFPRRRTEDHDDYYYEPALPGGAAGSVHITDSSGDPYEIHRAEGVRGGPVTISGIRDGGEDLLRELIGGVDDAFYQNVFSISLAELQSFEDLGRGEITERIYSAGLGIGNISLREVAKRLDDRLSRFQRTASTRSSAGSLFDLERDLRASREELEDRRRELAGYDRLSDELRELDRSATDLEQQLKDLRTTVSRTQHLLELRDPWLTSRRLQDEILLLPATNAVPIDGVDRLHAQEQDARSIESRISGGDRRNRERERLVSGLPIVEAFALRENDVRTATSRIGYYQEAVQDLPKREAEAAEIESGVVRDLAGIGPEWTTEKVSKYGDATGTIARIQAAADARAEVGRAASQAKRDLTDAGEMVQQSQEALRIAKDQLQATPEAPSETHEDLERKRDRLDTLEGALAELESSRSQHAASDDRIPVPGGLPLGIILAIVGMLGIVWAIVSSEITGAAIGVAAVIAGTILAVMARKQLATVSGAEETQPNIANEVASIARELDLPSPLSARTVVEMRNAVGRQIDRKRESTILTKNVDNATASVVTARERRDAVVETVDRSETDQAGANTAWSDLLHQLGLHAHFERDDALSAVNDLGLIAGRTKQVAQLRQRVSAMGSNNAETDTLLASIFGDAELENPTPGAGLTALRELERQWEDHVEAVGQRQTLNRESADWKDEKEGLSDSLNRAKDVISGLLSGAGCETTEQFRELAAQLENRRRLENELDAIKRSAPDLFGTQASEIDTALERAEPEQLEAELQALREKVTQTGEERDAAVGQAGEVKAALKQMETEAEVARLHARIDELTEQLREDARQWSVLTVARSLLDQTREEFQEQRQPSLLLAASRYFNRMTLGRYASVRAVIGEERFEAVTGDGRPISPEHLSRGAAEQLWLSIRFALVDEYGSGSPLPMVLDDLLVNFDPRRARAACTAISALSERQQVIFLTCQPSTVSMLKEAVGSNPAAIMSLINLDDTMSQRVDDKPGSRLEDSESDSTGIEPDTVPVPTPPETPRPRMQPLL
ncbi:MAG: AAA family ATPase [Dehalococcoidia bacterium]